MAFSLNDLQSPSKRPLIVTICADAGMGKTSLAALWPDPVIIRTEDGSRAIEGRKDVALTPVFQKTAEVFEALLALAIEKHSFRTVVIDSVTRFNSMAEAEIVTEDGAKSINQACGGYGAGYAAASNMNRELFDACQYLADTRGLHIVFIAHADVETLDLPDQPQFSRYTIRMNKKSVSHYIDNVDMVAFIKLQTFTSGSKEDKVKKATTTGQRIVTCYPTPAHVSKNRLGIKTDLEFPEGVNPFSDFLK